MGKTVYLQLNAKGEVVGRITRLSTNDITPQGLYDVTDNTEVREPAHSILGSTFDPKTGKVTKPEKP